MLTNVYTKAVHDRWRSVTVATVLLAGWFLLAASIYQDIDISLYTDLPEGVRELMGIPEGADAATLSYNVMLSFAAALTMTALAISMGAASIAGEERDGTIGLLLANPRSRTHVAVAKLAAMVTLMGIGCAALWGAGRLVPVVLGIEIGATRVGAMVLHLGLIVIWFGCFAFSVGAWTGRRSTASSLTVGVLLLSYFAAGLLPLIDGLSAGAKVVPWYYFDGSDPLINGVRWTHLGVLATTGAALVVIGLVRLGRRDLVDRESGAGLRERLRANDVVGWAVGRLSGSARVSQLWRKTASEHQGVLIITAGLMFALMGVAMGPMYTAIEEALVDAAADFPEEIMAIAGSADLSTPEGWFEAETYSLMAPIAVTVVTAGIAVRAIAGEEHRGTMSLVLASPVRRSSVVAHTVAAMALHAAVVGTATFAGVVIASAISDLGIATNGIAAASLLVTLLGFVFGCVALLVSAATGNTRLAVAVTVGVALTSHLLNSFLPLRDDLADWARLTPSHYATSQHPLSEGLDWANAAVLIAAGIVLAAAAVGAFERRALHQG